MTDPNRPKWTLTGRGPSMFLSDPAFNKSAKLSKAQTDSIERRRAAGETIVTVEGLSENQARKSDIYRQHEKRRRAATDFHPKGVEEWNKRQAAKPSAPKRRRKSKD